MQRALIHPYHCYWYLPIALASACILCVVIFNSLQIQQLAGTPAQQSEETLLFEAQTSEYILLSERDAEQGKSADMRVDMTGNGDFVDFLIAYNDDHKLAGTNVKLTDGIDTGL